MARALAVFRQNGAARQKAERDQQHVVVALSAALDCLAGQDLEHRIEQAFPDGYEELRSNYNTPVGALATAMRIVRVGTTGEQLTSIVDQIAAAEGLVARIARTAAHQAKSLEQVNVAVAAMDRMTQANAAMVEQSWAATRSLSNEAQALTQMVSSFRTRDTETWPTQFTNPQSQRRQSATEYSPPKPVIARYGT